MKKISSDWSSLKLLIFGQAYYLIKLCENLGNLESFAEIFHSSCAAIVVGVMGHRPIRFHINDLGLLDVAKIHSSLSVYEEYENSLEEQMLFLRGSELYQQLELMSTTSEENVSGLSDYSDPVLICQIIDMLRYPKDTRLLSTLESVLYNQANKARRNEMKNPRHNLIESIFVSEVLLKDVKCNNRNMYLPEFIENFRKSETVSLLSSVFGVMYFESDVKNLTEIEQSRIELILRKFEDVISKTEEKVKERYENEFELYFDVIEKVNLELRNLGGIYCFLAGEDVALLYEKLDAVAYEGPMVKKHSSNPIPSLFAV